MNTQRKVVYGERQRDPRGARPARRGARHGAGRRPRRRRPVRRRARRSARSGTSTACYRAAALYPTRLTRPTSRRRRAPRELEEIGARGRARRLRGEGAGARRRRGTGEPILRELERMVLLSITDTSGATTSTRWTTSRRASGCARYGQKDPLVEFQREGYSMFEAMKEVIRDEFVRYIYRIELVRQDEPTPAAPAARAEPARRRGRRRPDATASAGDKIPRNAPCPCGSGRKYKKCHGHERVAADHERAHRAHRGPPHAGRRGEGVPLTSPASRPARPSSSSRLSEPGVWDDPARGQRLTTDCPPERRRRTPRAIGQAARRRARRRTSCSRTRTTPSWRRSCRDEARRRSRPTWTASSWPACSPASTTPTAPSRASHAGAGGVDSQDWTEMLLRMYLRWAEREGLQAELDEVLPGDEAGIKSATLHRQGHERVRAAVGGARRAPPGAALAVRPGASPRTRRSPRSTSSR